MSSNKRKKLTTIERPVERRVGLTSQLLGYARRGKYRVNPINLNQLAEETSNALLLDKFEKILTLF